VTAADLPEYYRQLNLQMTILPSEAVTGESWAVAHERMTARLAALLHPAPAGTRPARRPA
jgi:hypothetical protein